MTSVETTPIAGRQADVVATSRLRTWVVLGGDPAAQPLAESLSKEAQRIAVFSPYRTPGTNAVPPFLHNTDATIAPEPERPGPIVGIWRLTATDRNHG